MQGKTHKTLNKSSCRITLFDKGLLLTEPLIDGLSLKQMVAASSSLFGSMWARRSSGQTYTNATKS